MSHLAKSFRSPFVFAAILPFFSCALCGSASAVPFTYKIPYAGTDATYRVTAVVALKDEPDWIIAAPLAGAVRTVNAENKGEFTDEWDMKDYNGAQVPSGAYLVKGIYMPAEKWKIDGEWHSLIAKYICSPGDSWTPDQARDNMYPPIHGHLMEPIYRVSVARNGKACFFAGYIENSFNPFIVNMEKPVGIDQVEYRFPSSLCAGGHACAYDGQSVWVSRQRSLRCLTNPGFGTDVNVKRKKRETLMGSGNITDLNVMIDGKARYLYSADLQEKQIYVINGGNGAVMTKISNVTAVATYPDPVDGGRKLYALHSVDGAWRVSSAATEDGLPTGEFQKYMDIPSSIGTPGDFVLDKQGNVFVAAGRHAYKYSPSGQMLVRFGKEGVQFGKYDPDRLLQANSVEIWTDKAGVDKLLICEAYGMQRVSEWDCATGTRIRDWSLCQNAHAGYTMDPQIPEHVYTKALLGNALHRYRVNYETGEWKLDAVWEGICVSHAGGNVPHAGLFPRVVNVNSNKYIFFGGGGYRVYGGYSIYKMDGYNCTPSTVMAAKDLKFYWWRDGNGDNKMQEDEYLQNHATGPGGSYWADTILPDMSILHIASKGCTVQRLAPSGWSDNAAPIYSNDWKYIITDTATAAAQMGGAKKPDALHGGTEQHRAMWGYSDINGDADKALYLAGVYYDKQKLGIDTAAKMCDAWKLSCWIPDGNGSYRQKWRVGKTTDGIAQPGEVYSTMHVSPPAYGLIGVQDVNGIYHVFTDKGMYVDTLMHHSFKYPPPTRGGMYAHSGESWFGQNFLNRRNGKVYIFMGRANNNIYEVPSWKPGFVKPLMIKNSAGEFETRQ